MQLEHSFSVPVGIEDAWAILLDIERIGPCMPGATIESVDGDDFTGNVKVKLGPINLTYKGKASFVEKDATAHRAVIDARGRDARGNGTASAKVTATLVAAGDASTTVKVLTDLDITGKPAQFGRGVMVDVGNKLIGQFADCLATTLTGPQAAPSQSPAASESASGSAAAAASSQEAPARSAAAKKAAKSAAKKAAAKNAPAKRVTARAAAKQAARPKPTRAPIDGPQLDAPISGSAPQPADDPTAAVPETSAAAVSGGSTPSFAAPTGVPSAPEPGEEPSVNGHASATSRPQREAEPIDLLQSAGPAVVKRLAPVVGPVAVAAVIILIARRRRSHK